MSNRASLLMVIARVRRAMPRNVDVMAICDALRKRFMVKRCRSHRVKRCSAARSVRHGAVLMRLGFGVIELLSGSERPDV
jgi:hypothetical protein